MTDKLISQLEFKRFNKSNVAKLPQTPGVYVYTDSNKNVLYIGKAKNLKSRVRSYTAKTLIGKTKKLVEKVIYFSYIEVPSELEALLLEARLVKKYMPEYNVALKDDKHPLYVAITKDEYPRIVLVRKSDKKKSFSLFMGPFPSAGNLYSVMKMLRRIFPYSDHKIGPRKCFYGHIGFCNPCPNEICKLDGEEKEQKKEEYLRNIRRVKWVLTGRMKSVRSDLEKQMKLFAKEEKFENAKEIRDKIRRLDYITNSPETITDPYLDNPNHVEDVRELEMLELKEIINSISDVAIASLDRVECYDIAHLSGQFPTASMVTFKGAAPDKNMYRHFKIYQKKTRSDYDSMSEVISRRAKHAKDWGVPDLIVADGGKGQVSSFIKSLEKFGGEFDPPIIGIAKKRETIIVPIKVGGKIEYKTAVLPKGNARNFIQRIRDESHRFARRLHHKQVLKEYGK